MFGFCHSSMHSIRYSRLVCANLVLAAGLGLGATAQAGTKDIVLDRIATPVLVAQPVATRTDAMAVSVLVESPDGFLAPRSTQALFRTGERLRIKVLASRNGRISIYNTNPAGVTSHVWSGDAVWGQETISPRMVLTGFSGEDKLHVVLEPTDEPQGVVAWLTQWLSGAKSINGKDVRLDVQSTPQVTYVLNPAGQGLVSTVRIVHTR